MSAKRFRSNTMRPVHSMSISNAVERARSIAIPEARSISGDRKRMRVPGAIVADPTPGGGETGLHEGHTDSG